MPSSNSSFLLSHLKRFLFFCLFPFVQCVCVWKLPYSDPHIFLWYCQLPPTLHYLNQIEIYLFSYLAHRSKNAPDVKISFVLILLSDAWVNYWISSWELLRESGYVCLASGWQIERNLWTNRVRYALIWLSMVHSEWWRVTYAQRKWSY